MAERPDETETELDVSSEPISPPSAMAIGMHKGRKRAGPDPKFDAFLDKQSRLIDLQTEHLHEQRAVILSRLRLGRIADRLKILLQAMTALTGLAIVLALAAMAWQAHEDHGLVVQPFSVPPDLAQRGLTGEVIASRLIDRLSQLQAETNSSRPASSYANDWGQDLKVEIPEAGVSIGELDRWLRSWLGHETTISGEVYRTSAGVSVAAHAGTAPSTVHAGSDAELDDLVRQAAEDVYAATQPYRYAIYLAQTGQRAQATAALEKLTSTDNRTDRMWAYVGLSTLSWYERDSAGAIRAASSSIAIDPKFAVAYNDRAIALTGLGHDEAALADADRATELIDRAGAGYLNQRALAIARHVYGAQWAALVGDFGSGVQELEVEIPALHGRLDILGEIATDQARWHDVTAGRQAETRLAPLSASASLATRVDTQDANLVFDAVANQELENWPALWTAYASVDQSKLPPSVRGVLVTQVVPLAALARAKLGDTTGAAALIATTPLDCYLCLRARGQIAAANHDWASTNRWFAEAVRQGPSLPFAHAEWARSLLDQGESDRAVAELKLAHQKSPHFADPLETWGEALMAKRDYPVAIKKFAEADKDAPKWGRNHLRWGEALMLSGRYSEARAQYQTASGLDLSIGDRAALNVLLVRAASGPLHG